MLAVHAVSMPKWRKKGFALVAINLNMDIKNVGHVGKIGKNSFNGNVTF